MPGHREGDLILGLGSSGIGTLVERTTRFTLLLHLPRMAGHGVGAREKNGPALAGHGAEAVRDAITRTIATLPGVLRRSLTWDQGAEMAEHPRLRIDTGLQVYFCDPHSPWQRGTNENTNGLLMGSAGTRRYAVRKRLRLLSPSTSTVRGAGAMRGSDDRTGTLSSYSSPDALVPLDHPLRASRPLVNAALEAHRPDASRARRGVPRSRLRRHPRRRGADAGDPGQAP